MFTNFYNVYLNVNATVCFNRNIESRICFLDYHLTSTTYFCHALESQH